jgi:hypothetical protein
MSGLDERDPVLAATNPSRHDRVQEVGGRILR